MRRISTAAAARLAKEADRAAGPHCAEAAWLGGAEEAVGEAVSAAIAGAVSVVQGRRLLRLQLLLEREEVGTSDSYLLQPLVRA